MIKSFWVKTGVFQPEILTNHHGNHFYVFLALFEDKNQNPPSMYNVTYFSDFYQVVKYHSKLKF